MKTKETKGITLISLVVIILVLIILAGVTISTLFGENRHHHKSIHSKKINTSSKRKGSLRATTIIGTNA